MVGTIILFNHYQSDNHLQSGAMGCFKIATNASLGAKFWWFTFVSVLSFNFPSAFSWGFPLPTDANVVPRGSLVSWLATCAAKHCPSHSCGLWSSWVAHLLEQLPALLQWQSPPADWAGHPPQSCPHSPPLHCFPLNFSSTAPSFAAATPTQLPVTIWMFFAAQRTGIGSCSSDV